jgi:hypothetical protein
MTATNSPEQKTRIVALAFGGVVVNSVFVALDAGATHRMDVYRAGCW